MGSIYQQGYDRAASTGLSDIGSWWLEVLEDDDTLFEAAGSNPQQPPASVWGRSGSIVTGFVSTWTAQTSGGNTGFDQVEARVNDGAGTELQLVRFTGTSGGDLPYSAADGEDISVTGGGIDVLDPGYAEMMIKGLDNIQAEYVIKDGAGSVLATINPPDTNHVPLQYGGGLLEISANLDFDNNSGSPWSVEEVEVRTNVNKNVIFQSSAFSASVADGQTLRFTTLSDETTNLVT